MYKKEPVVGNLWILWMNIVVLRRIKQSISNYVYFVSIIHPEKHTVMQHTKVLFQNKVTAYKQETTRVYYNIHRHKNWVFTEAFLSCIVLQRLIISISVHQFRKIPLKKACFRNTLKMTHIQTNTHTFLLGICRGRPSCWHGWHLRPRLSLLKTLHPCAPIKQEHHGQNPTKTFKSMNSQCVNKGFTHLMSMTWLTATLGWLVLPSHSSYRKSLKSHTTARALCQPFFTPVGFGTWLRQDDQESGQHTSAYMNEFTSLHLEYS